MARQAGRKDLEAIALRGQADAHRSKLELPEARALLTQALELAEESGAIASRGWIFLTWARIHLLEETWRPPKRPPRRRSGCPRRPVPSGPSRAP